MARTVCVNPCPPSPALSVYLPFMGDMGAQANLSIEGGCAGCDVVGNLLIQLGPALGAMGIPMCILGCVGAVVSVVIELGKAIPLFTNIDDLAEAIAAVPDKCACVVGFALPPPAGTVCEMVKTVTGVLNVVNKALICVTGLLGDIINANVRISGLHVSAVAESRIAAACVSAQTQAMTNSLMSKFASVAALFALVKPIVDFIAVPLSAVPGGDDAVEALHAFGDALNGFSTGVPAGTPPDECLNALLLLQNALGDVLSIMNPVASLCP